jgi:hypothetical protein
VVVEAFPPDGSVDPYQRSGAELARHFLLVRMWIQDSLKSLKEALVSFSIGLALWERSELAESEYFTRVLVPLTLDKSMQIFHCISTQLRESASPM